MDALSVCGTPLAILSQTLAPAALLNLDLLPEEVALEPVSAPYKYMLACKVRGVPTCGRKAMCKLASASPVVIAAGALRWMSCQLETLPCVRHSLICLLGLPEGSERYLKICLTFLMPWSCR